MTEREREALMRLTMCAREECSMCKYQGECNFDFQYELATKNMNILADALRKTEPTISKMEQVETMSCQECRHYVGEYECEPARNNVCAYEPKDEPQTSGVVWTDNEMPMYHSTTASSDEPQTCFNCKHNVTKHTFDHACGGCTNLNRWEKDEPQTEYKKWEAPPKVDIPTVPTEITTCVSVLASALEIEDEPQTERSE